MPTLNPHLEPSQPPVKKVANTPVKPITDRRPKRKKEFSLIMTEATFAMPAHQRAFSRVIHQPFIAAISDLLGATVARPNPLLFGAIASFFTTLSVYVLAKNLGYRLSGFEPVGAFILGWLIGLAYDFLKLMIIGKK